MKEVKRPRSERQDQGKEDDGDKEENEAVHHSSVEEVNSLPV